jgi:hypothetical protein
MSRIESEASVQERLYLRSNIELHLSDETRLDAAECGGLILASRRSHSSLYKAQERLVRHVAAVEELEPLEVQAAEWMAVRRGGERRERVVVEETWVAVAAGELQFSDCRSLRRRSTKVCLLNRCVSSTRLSRRGVIVGKWK